MRRQLVYPALALVCALLAPPACVRTLATGAGTGDGGRRDAPLTSEASGGPRDAPLTSEAFGGADLHVEHPIASPDTTPAPDAMGRSADEICQGMIWGSPPFAAGSGSPASPWVICSAKQLDRVRGYLGSSFILGADIDLASYKLAPIGGCDPDPGFSGDFDGNGHAVSNLSQVSTKRCYGLFGRLVGSALVRDLALRGVSIRAGGRTGALAGLVQDNAKVRRCSVEGSVAASCSTATCGSIGGLVGVLGVPDIGKQKKGGYIVDSFATVDVSGPIDAGGLVGWFYGEIDRSYAAGTLTMTMASGWGFGGLVGGFFNGAIRDSFATGASNGGALHSNNSTGTVTNSYFDPKPQVFSNRQHAVYNGNPPWDFVNVWIMGFSGGLPKLR